MNLIKKIFKELQESIFGNFIRSVNNILSLTSKQTKIYATLIAVIVLQMAIIFTLLKDNPRGANRVKLFLIAYPNNQSKNEVKKYVAEIIHVSANQREWASDDPQGNMLKKVGKNNVDILVDALDLGTGSTMYIHNALQDLIDNSHKQLMLMKLYDHPWLLRYIIENGWLDDAKDTIYKILDRPYTDVNTKDLIKAVVHFQDTGSYEKIIDHWINYDWSPYSTYQETLKDLHGIDMASAVSKGWGLVNSHQQVSNPWKKSEMALVAIRYGYIDALEYLIENLSREAKVWNDMTREAIFLYSDVRGTDQDIRDWFYKNKKTIYFDYKTQKYVEGKK